MANCPTIGSNSNAVSLAVAKTCTADAQTVWYYQQPNDITSFAATLEKVARSPLSLDRQRRKGGTTNLTAAPAFPQDNTVDLMAFWATVAMFTIWKGVETGEFGYNASAVVALGYTVDITTSSLAENTLVIARGFAATENNGLKLVLTGATTTSIPVAGLVVETPTAAHSLHECGFRFTDGDLEIDADGNLTSTVKDFTELPLLVGGYIYIGGDIAVNQLTGGAGFARIRAIETNRLVIDNQREAFAPDTGVGKLVDLFYGVWCRNVSVDNADFSINSLLMEVGYDFPGGRQYEYAESAVLNTLAVAMPITDKSTLDFATVATDITEATATRRLGTWKNFTANELFNTSDDIARLRIKDIDGNGLSTYFTDCTVNINNNVSPKNILGQLKAADINYGNFEVGETMTTLFTDILVTSALRNNTTASFEIALQNNDGAVVIDQPEITLGGGEKAFPVNDKVEIALENEAFGSSLGYTQSVTIFRYVPSE